MATLIQPSFQKKKNDTFPLSASKLQQEYNDEQEAHTMHQKMGLEDEFTQATIQHDLKTSESQARKLENRLNC